MGYLACIHVMILMRILLCYITVSYKFVYLLFSFTAESCSIESSIVRFGLSEVPESLVSSPWISCLWYGRGEILYRGKLIVPDSCYIICLVFLTSDSNSSDTQFRQ